MHCERTSQSITPAESDGPGGVDAPPTTTTSLSVFIFVQGGGGDGEGGGADLSPNNTLAPGVWEFVLRKYICAVCRRACMHEE